MPTVVVDLLCNFHWQLKLFPYDLDDRNVDMRVRSASEPPLRHGKQAATLIEPIGQQLEAGPGPHLVVIILLDRLNVSSPWEAESNTLSQAHCPEEPNQNLFSTGYRRRCRRYDDFQSCNGGFKPSPSWDVTSGGSEI
jgi:hypothetical protein